MVELPLRYELVPRPLWGVSLCRRLKGARWDRLRAEVRAEAEGRCRCCGQERAKGMVCHEVWDYDDDAGCATLSAFRLICPDCNFVTHRGMAGNINLADHADAHMVRVNGITLDAAHRLYDQAHAQWADRSTRHWTVRIAPHLIERYPVLEDVELAPG